MDLDRILHAKKHFAELTNDDITAFLRDRTFMREHLNLEFKSAFAVKSGGKYDIREFCRYIVGFSNEEGGLVIYGVADKIKEDSCQFPDYLAGLDACPSPEDLSQWVTQRIHPLIQSPAIRLFDVEGKRTLLLKVPEGVNKPYCYHEPPSKAVTFFKKTAAGIHELAPDEIRELHRTAILDQSALLLRAARNLGGPPLAYVAEPVSPYEADSRLEKHRKAVLPKLENVRDFGYLSIYVNPYMVVDLRIKDLKEFLEQHRYDFSESMRFAPDVEVFQDGVSVGFFPTAIDEDIKSAERVTIYRDGLVAFDSQVDPTMDRNKGLNPYWLAYEIQRHLQLAKALLEEHGVETVHVELNFENIDDFVMRSEGAGGYDRVASPYAGNHRPVERNLRLAEIPGYRSPERNIAAPVVRDMMDEVSRIFGLSSTLPHVWRKDGRLYWVEGLENQR